MSRAGRAIGAAVRKDLEAALDLDADDIDYVVEGSPEVRGRGAADGVWRIAHMVSGTVGG